jgi:membrane protein implicated in regulation of membrane protease activity
MNQELPMSIETSIAAESGRSPVLVVPDDLAVAVAVRFAIIGVFLAAIGGIALIAGGLAPLTALALAVCGGGLAFVSFHLLTVWERAYPAATDQGVRCNSRSTVYEPISFIE